MKEDTKKIVEEIERNPEFAKQVILAYMEGSAPVPRLEEIPDTSYMRALARIEVEIIYANFNNEHRPTELVELREKAKIKTSELNALGVWGYMQVGDDVAENTIDRVCNALASKKYYKVLLRLEGNPPLICEKPKVYWPNPDRFEGDSREKLKNLVNGWKFGRKTK